jgi:hypothetical protein
LHSASIHGACNYAGNPSILMHVLVTQKCNKLCNSLNATINSSGNFFKLGPYQCNFFTQGTWMVLGAKFRSWANFPWFFLKKRFVILKMIHPNSKG